MQYGWVYAGVLDLDREQGSLAFLDVSIEWTGDLGHICSETACPYAQCQPLCGVLCMHHSVVGD